MPSNESVSHERFGHRNVLRPVDVDRLADGCRLETIAAPYQVSQKLAQGSELRCARGFDFVEDAWLEDVHTGGHQAAAGGFDPDGVDDVLGRAFHPQRLLVIDPLGDGEYPVGSSSGGGGDLGKAVLILAIVLVAVLPIVLYLATDDAPAIVEQRFHCPSFQLDAQGGVDIGFDKVSGVGQTRFTFGWSYFGADFQYEYSGIGQRNLATHVMLRFKPKNFIEPAIALGYRNIVYGNTVKQGIEVIVPSAEEAGFWREIGEKAQDKLVSEGAVSAEAMTAARSALAEYRAKGAGGTP